MATSWNAGISLIQTAKILPGSTASHSSYHWPTVSLLLQEYSLCYRTSIFGLKSTVFNLPHIIICSLGTIVVPKKTYTTHKFTNPKNTAHRPTATKIGCSTTSSCQVARWAPCSDPLAGRLCQSPWPRIDPVGSHRSPESCLSLVRINFPENLGVISRK